MSCKFVNFYTISVHYTHIDYTRKWNCRIMECTLVSMFKLYFVVKGIRLRFRYFLAKNTLMIQIFTVIYGTNIDVNQFEL